MRALSLPVLLLTILTATEACAKSVISPFFVEVTPEIRTTYQSLGKIVEDRPMQVTNLRFGFDTGMFGRFGVRNWDVSSLTGRRHDAHRHALYHWEWGPTWEYDIVFEDGWKLHTDLTHSWTIYQGFRSASSNKSYLWWQIDQSLENPYLVPFYRIRRTFRGSDYLYFKAGVRKKIPIWESLYVTPSVFAEGGNGRNFKRVIGANPNDGWGSGGVSSVSFRLELGWTFNANFTAYGYVEQYEVGGGEARDVNGDSTYRCAHNDWTHGGAGICMKF